MYEACCVKPKAITRPMSRADGQPQSFAILFYRRPFAVLTKQASLNNRIIFKDNHPQPRIRCQSIRWFRYGFFEVFRCKADLRERRIIKLKRYLENGCKETSSISAISNSRKHKKFVKNYEEGVASIKQGNVLP